MLAELTLDRDDPGGPARFLKAALVAHYARLTGEFTDVADINSSLHLWVRRHAHEHLELRSPNQFFDFVERLIKLAKIYRTYQAASHQLHRLHDLDAIFCNATNGLTNQMSLILAAIRPTDPPTIAKQKARLAANFTDRWYVLRVLADEPALPRDLDDLMPTLVPQLRKCDAVADVATYLASEMPDDDGFAAVTTYGMRGNNSAQVRYLLARLTAFAERAWGATDLTVDYLAADRPWQIEHIFANRFERHPELADAIEFRLLRNRLGVLGLLKATVNMSLQDDTLERKVEVYRSENLLLRCLHKTFQQNNKPIRMFLQTSPPPSAAVSKVSSRNGSPPHISPVDAAATGSRSRSTAPRKSSSSATSPAAADASVLSAPWLSPSPTTPAPSATPAASVPASPPRCSTTCTVASNRCDGRPRPRRFRASISGASSGLIPC